MLSRGLAIFSQALSSLGASKNSSHIAVGQTEIPLGRLSVDLDSLETDILLQKTVRKQGNGFGNETVKPLPGVIFSRGKLFHACSPLCVMIKRKSRETGFSTNRTPSRFREGAVFLTGTEDLFVLVGLVDFFYLGIHNIVIPLDVDADGDGDVLLDLFDGVCGKAADLLVALLVHDIDNAAV